MKQHAKQLATNPLLEKICNEREADIIERWRSTSSMLERESAWYELKAIEGFREYLATTISNIFAGDGDTSGGTAGSGDTAGDAAKE